MANNIQKVRRKLGLTASEVARRLGMNAHTFRRYDRNETDPRFELAERIAKVLDCSIEDLINSNPMIRNTTSYSDAVVNAPVRTQHPQGKLPLYAYASGALQGEEVVTDAPYDFIDRPVFIGSEADAYAVRVIGESMEPRYYAGEIVYAVRNMPPRRGEFVVVQYRRDDKLRAIIKQYVSANDECLRLRQFNPDRELTIDRAEVVAVDTIRGATY